MFTQASTEPVDYAVIGASGAAALLAVAACIYTLPWRRTPSSVPKSATRGFNVLWHGRATLSLLSALWALSPLLRVSRFWGSNSFIFGPGVTSWTGAGWMCRIYLTVGLGVLQPLCAFLALLMLTAALSRRHRPEALRHPNARLLGLAALCTLPVAAAQAAVAWLSLAVRYHGQPLEASPQSVLGRFFATYWQGTPEQCGGSGSDVDGGAAAAGEPGAGGCTLCTFPAAAAIVHALFSAAFLLALAVTCSRLAAAVLNTRLRRRVRLFQAAFSLLAVAGVAAVGVSVVDGPFSWLNQACWAAYAGTVALTVALVEWEVVVWPVRDLRSVDKRLALWADATAAAFAAAGSDDAGLDPQSSGSAVLIKAHNRSAEAEAYAQAEAATRTMLAAQARGPAAAAPTRLPPPLQLPPPPPAASPARSYAAPTAPPSLPPLPSSRAGTMSGGVPALPPLPSPAHWQGQGRASPQLSPQRSQRGQQPLLSPAHREAPSAPALPPGQLFP